MVGINHFASPVLNPTWDSVDEEVVFLGKHSFSSMEQINPSQRDDIFNDQNQERQQQLKVDNLIIQDMSFDPYQQPTQLFQETTWNNHKVSNSRSSLELLRNHGSRFKMLSEKNIRNSESSMNFSDDKLSTEGIIRVAGARYVQFSSHWSDGFCIPSSSTNHPYGMDQWHLSEEENKDVELSQFLFAAVERVESQQFERASKLLLYCQWNSSPNGNPLQRVIFHFSQALRERINKETGKFERPQNNNETELLLNIDPKKRLICHQKIPFNQVMQFTGIQAIVEHVASETKIHVIDLDIRSGVQCTALMQALAERQDCIVEIFKVTAIGYNACKTMIEETGKNLASFAASLKFPFSYKVVLVSDMLEIKEDDFEIEKDEAVAVYSPYFLRTLISRLDCMENLMRVLRNIKPCIMIVLEMEANHNSTSFVNRFIEALFFYAAFFDLVGTCMKEENECRVITEAILSAGIRNIVATEGRERTVRNVKIDVWRRFFARYRIVETGFSDSSLYHADLVAKEFAYGNFCTMEKQNGKCLIIGWKGTPMHSISAWKFL